MPALAWLVLPIYTALSKLFDKALGYFTKRILAYGFMVIVVTAAVLALKLAIDTALAGVSLIMPSYMSQGASLIMPGNTTTCMTAIIAGHLARNVYDWAVGMAKVKLYIT